MAGVREALSTAGEVGLLAFLVVLGVRGLDTGAEQLEGMAWLIVLGLPLLVAAVLLVPAGRPERLARPRPAFPARLRLVIANPAFSRVVLFLRGFPITRQRHAEVRAAIEARCGALSDAQRFL